MDLQRGPIISLTRDKTHQLYWGEEIIQGENHQPSRGQMTNCWGGKELPDQLLRGKDQQCSILQDLFVLRLLLTFLDEINYS